MRTLVLVLVSFVLFASGACSSDAPTTTDNHGLAADCQVLPDPAGPCDANGQCPSGQVCGHGSCFGCVNDGECDSSCFDLPACVYLPDPAGSCDANGQCASGLACVAGNCFGCENGDCSMCQPPQ